MIRSGIRLALMVLAMWLMYLAADSIPDHPPVAARKPVTTTLPPTTTTTTTLVNPTDMSKWYKVAWCETHANWKHTAPADGGIGILQWNWVHYGGLAFAPAPHLATPQQQVYIAKKIQRINGAGDYVPDQDGNCSPW